MRPKLLRVLFLNLIFAEEFSVARMGLDYQSFVRFDSKFQPSGSRCMSIFSQGPYRHAETATWSPASLLSSIATSKEIRALPLVRFFFSSLALSEMCPLVLYYSLAMEIDLLAVD